LVAAVVVTAEADGVAAGMAILVEFGSITTLEWSFQAERRGMKMGEDRCTMVKRMKLDTAASGCFLNEQSS
jgi:hypothetical protein